MASCGTDTGVKPGAPSASGAAGTGPVALHPLTGEQPGFFRLGNMNSDHVPVRVGILLPFNNGSPATRALASSMLKAAELAVFDSGNHDILLMSADEGSNPEASAEAARSLLQQGAEIIVGPLFSQAAQAVGPIAADRAVPVISFSTDRKVAGKGVYLLSFLPEGEVRRVVAYAAGEGHLRFAAMVPQTIYGQRVGDFFKDSVAASAGTITDVEKFVPSAAGVIAPAHAVAVSKPDSVLIAQGGPLLRDIASALAGAGANPDHVKFLGTGLWDDPAAAKDPLLAGGLFAAPSPQVDAPFIAKYKNVYGTLPPQLATLAYDAVSLTALLAGGKPYNRFTPQALTDPNGYSGVDGIFRFLPDGTSERGLAVISIDPDGEFTVVSPAPTTFQSGS